MYVTIALPIYLSLYVCPSVNIALYVCMTCMCVCSADIYPKKITAKAEECITTPTTKFSRSRKPSTCQLKLSCNQQSGERWAPLDLLHKIHITCYCIHNTSYTGSVVARDNKGHAYFF